MKHFLKGTTIQESEKETHHKLSERGEILVTVIAEVNLLHPPQAGVRAVLNLDFRQPPQQMSH